MHGIKIEWTYPYQVVYGALFGMRLSYVMRNWLRDVRASSHRGFM